MGTQQKLQDDELLQPGSRIREGVATGHSGLEAPLHHHHLPAKEMVVLALCIAGALAYPVLVVAFGGLTLAELRTALKRKRNDPPITDTLP